MQIRRSAAALTSAAALSITGVAMATPAQAAPVITGGLVNVTVVDLIDGDVLSDNNVAVGVAANVQATVCGVQVGAQVLTILSAIPQGQEVVCENKAGDTQVVVDQITGRR